MLVHLAVVRLLALLSDLTDVAEQDIFWKLLDVGSRELEGAPDPMALLALTRTAWAAGEVDQGKALLAELPAAVEARFSAEADPTLKLDSLRTLRRFFDQIGGLAVRRKSFDDCRLLAEAQRDLLGRIAMHRAGGKAEERPPVVPDAETLARIGGPFAVLEWLDTVDGLAGLVTFVDRDGSVTAGDLSDPGVDLDALADKVAYRVSNWHPDRRGDPFDLPDWQKFRSWLHGTLEGRLPEDGQLVVIEHPDAWGLQWHVAAAPKWRTSYIPSWTSLLHALGSDAHDKGGPIGVAIVVKFGDAPLVSGPLEQSAEHALALGARLGVAVDVRRGRACDHAAVVELLESCESVKFLCHGYADPEENDVALFVAVDGELPLADSVVANTPAGRRHRFGWQDCQALTRSPRVVFSPACKSGLTHPAGLGERLGFYRVLNRSGCHSMIAPRWNIRPSAVVPILDDAMTRHLEKGEALGDALHHACLEAATTQPNWIAWALALEGDWK